MSDTFKKEIALNKMGEELVLYLETDHAEEVYNYSVSWRGLCGYFSVMLECATPEDAIALFKALQLVTGIDET